MANRDNSSVLAGCYRELSSGMNEAGCRLYLRPRANSPDKAGKPQSGQMRVHVLCTEVCPKIIYPPAGNTRASAHRLIMRCVAAISIRAVYWVIEVICRVNQHWLRIQQHTLHQGFPWALIAMTHTRPRIRAAWTRERSLFHSILT